MTQKFSKTQNLSFPKFEFLNYFYVFLFIKFLRCSVSVLLIFLENLNLSFQKTGRGSVEPYVRTVPYGSEIQGPDPSSWSLGS